MARILVVDDDALLRDTVTQLLSLDKHQVTEADDGRAAVALIQGGLSVDLVVTDMLMPGLDGAQLIVELKRLRPGLPVIAMSGGRRALSPGFSLDTAQLVGALHSLAKPFSRAALQNAVHQALKGHSSTG